MNSARSGFSIIEIMVVIAIGGMIMAIGIPMFTKYRKNAAMTTTKATLRNIEGAIDEFYGHTGQYPVALRDLVTKPLDEKIAKRWDGPYFRKDVFEDSFKHEIQYQVTKGQKHPYELYSYGPNGENATPDEWINASDL